MDCNKKEKEIEFSIDLFFKKKFIMRMKEKNLNLFSLLLSITSLTFILEKIIYNMSIYFIFSELKYYFFLTKHHDFSLS